MFKPVYNYKGVPILPTSKNVYRPGRYAKRSHWKKFFLAIVLIAVIVFVVWKFSVLIFSEKMDAPQQNTVAAEVAEQTVPKAAQNNVIMPEKVSAPNQIRPLPEQKKKTVVPVVSAVTKEVPAPKPPTIQMIPSEQTERTAVTQEQFEARVKIEQLLRQKKYEEARAALETLFTNLPQNTVLYPHAQKLLAIATDGLKKEGAFSNSGTVEYTIKSGDSLSKIATEHNTTVTEIMRANGMANPNRLKLGQKLKVPKNTWSGTIFVGRKKLYVYESGKLIRIYSLNIANIPSIPTEGRFTVAGKNPEWNLYGLGLSDIKTLKDLIPIGTEIKIER